LHELLQKKPDGCQSHTTCNDVHIPAFEGVQGKAMPKRSPNSNLSALLESAYLTGNFAYLLNGHHKTLVALSKNIRYAYGKLPMSKDSEFHELARIIDNGFFLFRLDNQRSDVGRFLSNPNYSGQVRHV
jgi:hypothetical protein